MRRKDTTSDMMRGYVACALVNLLKNDDISQVTVKEVAFEAGVSRSTFYRLFDSKDGVIAWWYGRLMGEYARLFATRPSHGRADYLRAIFDSFAAHRDELLLLHERGLTHLMLDVLRMHMSGGRTGYATAYHVGGVYGVVVQWLDRGMSDTPESMTAESLAIMSADFIPAAVEKARLVRSHGNW